MTTILLLILVVGVLLLMQGVVYLGTDRKTGQRVYLPADCWKTHLHLLGGTGKGKTTLIETMLHQLLLDPRPACHFIIDRMGSFSFSLLAWFASPWCPQWVRDRLVYIEGANERLVCPLHLLRYDTPAHGYYKVGRTTDVILRAWASQNIEETPRLARWIFNVFWAAAQLGLTVADCAHLLMPGSPLHDPMLRLLPAMLQAEFREIQQARGGEVGRMLEAPRNRLKPFFENPILRAIFGSTRSNLDVLRFMREGRIVLVNLAPQNRLSGQVSDAYGAMLLNEILAVLRSQPTGERYRTFIWLDEFQRFAKGPDVAEALPEMRQMLAGGGFIVSHQTLAQLESDETNLREIIYQCQTRGIFGVQGADADELAHELASITYRDKWVKDEMRTLKQLQTGHEVRLLGAWSQSDAEAKTWSDTYGTNWSAAKSISEMAGWQHSDQHGSARRDGDPRATRTGGGSDGRSGGRTNVASDSQGGNASNTNGGSITHTNGASIHEQLVPILHTFEEVTRRSYYDFNEQAVLWGQSLRNQARGQCVLRMVDDPTVYEVDIERHAPGYLSWDLNTLRDRYPQAIEALYALVEANYGSELFVSPEQIERETAERLERVLHPVIELRSDEHLVLEDRTVPTVPAQPARESAYGY